MEAPRFFNNKTRTFSSAVLAVAISAAACGPTEPEKGFHIATPYTSVPTPFEHVPMTVNTNVIDIDGSPILSQLTVDHNCGVVLKPGDKTTIVIPLESNPQVATAEFDLTLTKHPSGALIFASLPVDGGHSIAIVDAANNIMPLGTSLPLGQDQILFAFFTQRKFKVKECAVDNPSIH